MIEYLNPFADETYGQTDFGDLATLGSGFIYNAVDGTPTFDASVKRTGRASSLSCSGGSAITRVRVELPLTAIKVASFYVYVPTGASATTVPLFSLYNGQLDHHFELQLVSGNTMRGHLRRDGVASYFGSAVSFPLDSWNRIDVMVNAGVAPWTVSWKLNGTVVDTAASYAATAGDMPTTTIRYIYFGVQGVVSTTAKFNDLAIGNASGDYPTSITSYAPNSTRIPGTSLLQYGSDNGGIGTSNTKPDIYDVFDLSGNRLQGLTVVKSMNEDATLLCYKSPDCSDEGTGITPPSASVKRTAQSMVTLAEAIDHDLNNPGDLWMLRDAGGANGTGTLNSTTTVTAATGAWAPGDSITGTGIPANTHLTNVSGTVGNQTLTLSQAATSSGSGVSLSSGGRLVSWYHATSTAKQWVPDFTSASLQAAALANLLDTIQTNGWHGIWSDNVVAALPLSQDPFSAAPVGINQATFEDMMVEFLATVHQGVRDAGYICHGNTFKFISGDSNSDTGVFAQQWHKKCGIYLDSTWGENWMQNTANLAHLRSTVAGAGDYFDGWRQVQEEAQSVGNFSCNQADSSVGTASPIYCRAVFLLGWSGRGGSFSRSATGDQYDAATFLDVGMPTGAIETLFTNCYTRRCAYGRVWVNSDPTNTRSISDPADGYTYHDVNGDPLTFPFNLAPTRGVIASSVQNTPYSDVTVR